MAQLLADCVVNLVMPIVAFVAGWDDYEDNESI